MNRSPSAFSVDLTAENGGGAGVWLRKPAS